MRALAVAVAALLSGCLYANVRAPRAYRSATPADVKSEPGDPLVAGEACGRMLLYLFAWGDTGYAAAAKAALKDDPEGVLYDVRVDQRVNSYVVGLYAKTCTVLSARVAKR